MAARISWPVTRTLLPARRTLPSSTYATPSSAAIWRRVFVVLRYCITEVRDTTWSSRTSARLVRMSSWIPSEKNTLSFSSLMLLNGSTARDFGLMAGTGAAPAGLASTTGAGAAGSGSLFPERSAKKTAAPIAITATAPKIKGKRDAGVAGVVVAGVACPEFVEGADPGRPASARPAPVLAAAFFGASSSRFTWLTNSGVGAPCASRVHW